MSLSEQRRLSRRTVTSQGGSVMTDELVTEPVFGASAFSEDGEAAALSAAAILLALRIRLRGDDRALSARGTEIRDDWHSTVDALPLDDVDRLGVPYISATGARWDPGEIEAALDRVGNDQHEAIVATAGALYESPSLRRAAELFHACLLHREEIVRVSAAAAYLEISTDPRSLVAVLRDSLGSSDEQTRDIAGICLASFDPTDEALSSEAPEDEDDDEGEPANTWLLVHGTRIIRLSTWWRPGSDFQTYFRGELGHDVYASPDRFDWSGRYTRAARAGAAVELLDWARDHALNDLEVMAHSHGGNVAMLATQGGLELKELVLLSCPVHFPEYAPNLSRVGRAVSVRVHMDLTILADRGGQRFHHAGIEEHVLDAWFRHKATHEVWTWRQFNIEQWI